jgi:hypothetical protein
MVKLRDGSEVRDRRLARLREFDPRSREHKIADVLGRKTPRTFMWQCGKHLDQGEEGACVGFATTHAMITLRPSLPGLTARFAIKQVYWEAQRADKWPGGAYPEADPRYEGTSVLWAMKRMRELGHVAAYRWAFGLDELILAVSWAGPAVLGLWWYEGMADPCSCGYLHPTGKRTGGHAILCKGVDIDRGHFVLHNSWGRSWGRGGDAWVSFSDMKWLLKHEGEAVIPTLALEPAKPRTRRR